MVHVCEVNVYLLTLTKQKISNWVEVEKQTRLKAMAAHHELLFSKFP